MSSRLCSIDPIYKALGARAGVHPTVAGGTGANKKNV